MGQYHYIVNITKREYLHPHDFGDGLKLMEFGGSADGTLMGLTLLLAGSNGPSGRGGGDWHPWAEGQGDHGDGRNVGVMAPDYVQTLQNTVPGRWCGDRIAIIGDYHEAGDVLDYDGDTPWDGDDERDGLETATGWLNVSPVVYAAMRLDFYTNDSKSKYEAGNDYARERSESIMAKVPECLELMKRTEYKPNA